MHCTLVPPYILQALARQDDPVVREAAIATLGYDKTFAVNRVLGDSARHRSRRTAAPTAPRLQRLVHDAQHGEDLPGVLVRAEGAPASTDVAVNEAYDGLGDTWTLYEDVYGRNSIDDAGLALSGTVHFSEQYDNAYWDGEQMVFGDGDGVLFNRFTISVDVIGHELTHGVTGATADLAYKNQSGALNESISDVFGIQVKQKALGQSAETSDWLIGADIVGPALTPALRSMKAPGTANQHDDQPADMDGYVVDGDVHTNSGIPNRAFYLVASTLGGNAWDVAGPVWYATLRDNRLNPTATFQEFARLTVANAQQTYGAQSKEAEAVTGAWDTVKVPL